MTERDFSQRAGFVSYEHADTDGRVLVSPFAVAVIGIRQEVLGVGRLIGATPDVLGGNPVIEIDDPNADGGTVEILGVECWWAPMDTGDERQIAQVQRIAALLAEHSDAILAAGAYARTLDSP